MAKFALCFLAAAAVNQGTLAFLQPARPLSKSKSQPRHLTSLWATTISSSSVFTTSPSTTNSKPPLVNLETWLTRKGVKHPAIELGESPDDGRGLYATRHIRKDELLFVVPGDLILRPSLPLGLSGVSAQTILALRLLLERHRGPQSVFAGYIRSLPPPEEMHMPLMWADDDLKLLDSPNGELFRWRQTVVEEGQDILKIVHSNPDAFEGLNFNMDEWLWARALTISRPYLLDRDDEWSLVIVPLVDFTNHRDDATCAIRSLEDGSIAFVADRPYAPHEQIWTSYGHVGAAHKFFTFGFLDELKTQNGKSTGVPGQGSCFLSFPLADDNHARELKLRVTEAVGLESLAEFEMRVSTRWAATEKRTATVRLEDEAELCRLMAYLRLAVAGPDTIDPDEETPLEEIWKRFDTGPPTPEDRAAIAVALDACRDIMKTAGERLVNCQNRIAEHDAAALKKPPKNASQAAALRTRSHRLKLASQWLQGELLAVQALAEYLLDAVGAAGNPMLSYDD